MRENQLEEWMAELVLYFVCREKVKEYSRNRHLTRNYVTHLEITRPQQQYNMTFLFCDNANDRNHFVWQQIESTRMAERKCFVKQQGRL